MLAQESAIDERPDLKERRKHENMVYLIHPRTGGEGGVLLGAGVGEGRRENAAQ